MRLLIAEDEHSYSDALVAVLEHNGYSVDAVYNGKDALIYGTSEIYDAILLDIMMPGMDGLTVLQRLREQNIQTPIMMLTARGETAAKIEGLNLGADDYLPKPFVMGELLARIAALTRRAARPLTGVNLSYGNVLLSRENYTINNGEKSVHLVNKEFQIMELLLANPKQVISSERFIERVWGYDADTDISVIWVNISNIRKKLLQIDANIVIRAVRGVGYSLEEKNG